MTYVNMVKPELAQRYTASGLWTNKTFFEFIDGARRGASRPRGVRRRPAPHQLWRAQ